MSDWKSRATKVEEPVSDWKSRSSNTEEIQKLSDLPSTTEVDTLGEQAAAIGLGLAKGATMNFSDRLEAAARSAIQDDSYDKLLQDIRARNKAYAEKYPLSSMGGELAGGIGSLFAGGAALKGAGLLAKGAGIGAEAASAARLAGGAAEAANVGKNIATAGETALSATKAAEQAAAVAKTVAPEISGSQTLGLLKGKLGTTIASGAGLGATAALGEVEDFTQSPSKTIDAALEGAIAGGAIAGAGHIVGKTIGKASDIFKKFPAAREYVKGADDARFLKELEKEGKGISSIYEDSHKRLAELQGEIQDGLVSKINKIDSKLSQAYDTVFDKYGKNVQISVEDVAGVADNAIASLEQKGLVASMRDQIGDLASVLKNPALDGSPRSISRAMQDLQNLSDKSIGINDRMGAQLFAEAKQNLKSMFIDKLPEEAQKLYKFTDDQYRAMSTLRNVNLKIPKFLEKDASNSFKQEEFNDAIKGLSKKFEMAAKGHDQQILDIDNALNKMNKIESDILKLNPEGVAEAAETPKIFKGIMDRARVYEATQDLVKGSLLATDKTAGLSHSSVARNVGYAAANVAEGAKDIATNVSRAVMHDVNKLAFSAPEKVVEMAKQMASSPNPNVVKYANQIMTAMKEQDLTKRRALLYVLSQQAGAYMSKQNKETEQ